jgi:hypothetical protein
VGQRRKARHDAARGKLFVPQRPGQALVWSVASAQKPPPKRQAPRRLAGKSPPKRLCAARSNVAAKLPKRAESDLRSAEGFHMRFNVTTWSKAAMLALTALVALSWQASDALATASVTNRDDKDHKITIIEGEKKLDFTLKPNQALENICAGGCVLRLNDNEDDDYQLEPKDVVSIEDGALYYDNDSEAEEPKKEEPKKQ